jgi:hypothetical protein
MGRDASRIMRSNETKGVTKVTRLANGSASGVLIERNREVQPWTVLSSFTKDHNGYTRIA